MRSRTEIIQTLTRPELENLGRGELSYLCNRLGIALASHYDLTTPEVRELIWKKILE